VLNHCAQLKVLDPPLWQKVSDALPEILVDPTCVSLGLLANAFGKASLHHETALSAVVEAALELTTSGVALEGRNIAMLANAVSKLRVRNLALMESLAEQVLTRKPELNAIDLMSVANAYARLSLRSEELFAGLRGPILEAADSFSMQNLGTLAHAYGKLNIRDNPVLAMIAKKLKQECDTGKPMEPDVMSPVVHAFAVRLELPSLDLARCVEFSLPRVVGSMKKYDIVLTVPALPRLAGFQPGPAFLRPVFERCLALLEQLTCNAIVGVLEAAIELQHNCDQFWLHALQSCGRSLERGGWDPKYMGQLGLLVMGMRSDMPTPGPGEMQRWPPKLPEGIENSLLRSIASCASPKAEYIDDLRVLADMAVAARMAGMHDATEFRFIHQRALALTGGLQQHQQQQRQQQQQQNNSPFLVDDSIVNKALSTCLGIITAIASRTRNQHFNHVPQRVGWHTQCRPTHEFWPLARCNKAIC